MYVAVEIRIMGKITKVKWLKEPQKHDYPAAEKYLSLTLEPAEAKKIAGLIKTGRDVGICGERHF